MTKLNPSIKHHLIIGALISAWIFIFGFFIRPFNDGSLSFRIWLFISVGFSLIAFLSYTSLSIIQQKVYLKFSKWNISFEIISLVTFHLLFLIGTFIYYKSPIINGGYHFLEFFNKIILKSALILTPIIILARRYSIKLMPIEKDIVTIRGENRLDILKIKKSDLICVSNSQNYVEIYYLQNGQLNSKLIRSTLKKIQKDLTFLIQIHRSHIINPSHFKSWKNKNTISLTQIELPVSKSYKEHLLSL